LRLTKTRDWSFAWSEVIYWDPFLARVRVIRVLFN
jgi:hypothetical protein